MRDCQPRQQTTFPEPPAPTKRPSLVTDDQDALMRAVPELANSPYGFLSPRLTLDYFYRRYIATLQRHGSLSECTLVDCGCGHGWNVLAFVQAGGKLGIGFDTDESKLRVARELSEVLHIGDRVLFAKASLTALPVADRSTDIFTCIETLEHLYGAADAALSEIQRTARKLILVTTPNQRFPMIAHDTRLPFAHWLPARLRRGYARVFGRAPLDDSNTFLTPVQIKRGLHDFELVSKFLGCSSYDAYRKMFPLYCPYIGSGQMRNLRFGKRLYYRFIYTLLGRRSFGFLPSITGIFSRRL